MDWQLCFENPKEAAAEIEKLRAELAQEKQNFKDCHADYQDCAKHLHKANFEVTHLKLQLAEMQSAFVDGYDKAKNEYRPMVHKLEDENEKLRFQLEQYELSDLGAMQKQLEERRLACNQALKQRDELQKQRDKLIVAVALVRLNLNKDRCDYCARAEAALAKCKEEMK